MGERPTYTLEDISLIHQRQRQNAASFKALVAVATLQQEFEAWLVLGDDVAQFLAQVQTKGRAVDIPTDRAWGGLKRILEGFQRVFAVDSTVALDAEERKMDDMARELEAMLIGPSLDFLKFTLVKQWEAIDKRLRRLNEKLPSGLTVREAIQALSLEPVVKRLQNLHAAYTNAVGLSTDPASPGLLQRWEQALDSLDGGLRFLIKDAPTRAAALDALNAPFVSTVNERKERELKAAKATRDAKDAQALANSTTPPNT